MTIFSSSVHAGYISNRSLNGAALLMDALCLGRDDLQLEALGESLSPWQLVGDSVSWGNAGHPQTSVKFHLLACACVIHGSLPLLRGLMRRPDFFDYCPIMDLREAKPAHLHEGLALGCALEAIARGRLDMLLEISAAETSWLAQPRTRLHARSEVSHFSNLHPDQTLTFLRHLAHSRDVLSAPLIACALWLQGCLPPANPHFDLRLHGTPFSSLWLDAACEAGHGDAIDHALSLGAHPSRQHVSDAASNGAMVQAAQMAVLARTTPPVQSGRMARSTFKPHVSCCIAESMGSSFNYALEKIADGYLHWRRPDDEWVEATYSDFLIHRTSLIANAVLVLSGALDMPEDSAPSPNPLSSKRPTRSPPHAAQPEPSDEAREKAKDQLASAARAMARCAPAETSDSELLAVEKARPGARVLSPELIFLARMGYPSFTQALNDSTPDARGAASKALWELAENALAGTQRLDLRAALNPLEKPDAQAQASYKQARHIKHALFEIYQHSSSLLGPTDLLFFEERLRAAKLDREFERAVLELSTALTTQRRPPLKV